MFSCLTLENAHKKKLFVKSSAVGGIGEDKAKNVLPFGQHSHKRTQTRYILLTK